jgi:hypothetical protein
MSDFNYGGTDEESAEIKKLNAEVVSYAPCAPSTSSLQY